MGLTLYLTNWAVLKAWDAREINARVVASVGPATGRRLCCSRFPADGQFGGGRVLGLTPRRTLAEPAAQWRATYNAQHGDPKTLDRDALLDQAVERYEAALRTAWSAPEHLERLAPGGLSYALSAWEKEKGASQWDGSWWLRGGMVEAGDTLYCACPRERSTGGICHRRVAAEVLTRAGWEVVLDGVEVPR